MVRVAPILGRVASVAGALLLAATSVQAGGFAIREQSTSGLGSAFAGIAAGGDLSSIYWNPAALAAVPGMSFESHYSLLMLDAELTATSAVNQTAGGPVDLLGAGFSATSGNIFDLAVVPASYGGMQLNSKLSIGVGLNSPFGLVSEPEDGDYAGAELARRASIFTINLNPVVSYKISDAIAIGVGPQVEYMKATLKFATGAPFNPSTSFKGDTDKVDLGFTAGVMLTPMRGTSIGLGFRSSVEHELRGRFRTQPGVLLPGPFVTPDRFNIAAKAKIETPEIVTLSLKQAINPKLTAMATFEWTNWSRFDTLTVSSTASGETIGAFVANAGNPATPAGITLAELNPSWDDSWFLSFGMEFDYTNQLQVRAGIAYEESPVQNPDQRLFALPDSNRLWLSAGATYALSGRTTIDLAYTHIFIEEVKTVQTTTTGATTVAADVEASTDIISFSLKRKFGGGEPNPLK